MRTTDGRRGSGGCTYAFAQAVPDTTVTINAGTLTQAVDASNVYAATLWLTWTGTATARVWQGSASGAFSAGLATTVGGVAVNALLVTGLTLGAIATVEFSTGTLGLVQLEAALPNAGPTRFERRRLNQELTLCQWTYQVSNAVVANLFQAGSAYYINCAFPFSAPMRALPTIAVINGTNAVNRPGVANYNVTGISAVFAPGTQSACVQLATNGTSVGLCEVYPGTLSLSAEL